MAWIVIGVTIVSVWTVVIRMAKKLPWDVLYTNVWFALFAQNLGDSFASFRHKAWGLFEVSQTEYISLFIILGIYPAFAILLANWYPYKRNWITKVGYLFAWSLFSTLYEWLAVVTGIVWHIHWNLICSFFLYPVIYYLLILQIRFHLWIKQMPERTGEREI